MHAFLNQSHRGAMKLKHFIDAYCRKKIWVNAILVMPNMRDGGVNHVSDDVSFVHKDELVSLILNSYTHSITEPGYIAEVIKKV